MTRAASLVTKLFLSRTRTRNSRKPHSAASRCRLGVEWLETRTLLSNLQVSISPHTIVESLGPASTTTATVTRLNTDNSQPLTVNLSSSNSAEATVPDSVVIPANQASTTLSVNAVPDADSDGIHNVTVTGTAQQPVPLGLDPSFGGTGSAFQNSITSAVALQPDGKIVAAGLRYTGGSSDFFNFAVSRYNPDGTLDPSFGGTGTVVTDVSGQADRAHAVVIQQDGKIVVGGTGGDGPHFYFVLARYNPDGSLDPSFGNGGKVVTNPNPNGSYSEIWDLALQADGKILAGGNVSVGGNSPLAVVRYNTDGTLDTTFGSGGLATSDPAPGFGNRAFGIAVQPDGNIVLAGGSKGGNFDSEFALARFTPDGVLDPSFGGTGTVLTDVPGDYEQAYGVALQPDGRIVVVGYTSPAGVFPPVYDFALARYNTDGSLDNSFGSGGITITNVGGTTGVAGRVAVQPDGRIVVVGGVGTTYGSSRTLVARYTPNGTLESSAHSSQTGIYGEDIALQPDGRIVVASEQLTQFGGFVERYTDFQLLTGSDTVAVHDDTAPVANNDSYSVNQGQTLTVNAPGVLANDTDADGDPLTAIQVSDPQHGTLSFNADGSFTYTPETQFSGSDSFTYQASDGLLASNVATVTITVNPGGSSPRLQVSINPHTIVESLGPAATTTATVTRLNTDISQPLTVNLTSSNPAEATVPDSVVIPANQASTTFSVSAVPDADSDGIHNVTVTGTAQQPVPLGLDPSFGTSGSVPQNSNTTGVALQSDGKIVTAGSHYNGGSSNFYDFAVSRYNPDGTLDLSFGGTGTVITDVSGQSDRNPSVVIQADGKIVVGGTAGDGPHFFFELVRYNPDGSLDPSFGNGGKVVTNPNPSGFYNEIWDLALQADGKILAAGDIDTGSNGEFAVARYNGDGTLDTTFGSGGIATSNPAPGFSNRAFGIAVQPDGNILLAGGSKGGNFDSQFALSRFTSAGVLDPTFGGSGTVLTDVPGDYEQAHGVVLQPDGRTVAVGYTSPAGVFPPVYDFALARYNPDGSLDNTFGTNGITITDFGGNDQAERVALQSDGRIVVIGGGVATSFSTSRTIVAGYTPNGTLDSSAFSSHSGFQGQDVALQPDGRIVVASAQFIQSGFVERYSDFRLLSGSDTVAVHDDTAPVANDDSYSVNQGQTLTVNAPGVLGNDSDADGDPLTAILVSNPQHGTLAFNADGSFTYTPDALFFGSDSFTYQASDGLLDSNVATVTITVNHTGGGGGPGDGTTLIGNRTSGTATATAKAITIAEGDNPTFTNKLTPLSGFEGFTFVNVLLTSITDHVLSMPPRAFLATVNGGEGPIPTGTISGSRAYAGESAYQVHVAINDAATDSTPPSATFKRTKAALTGKPILIFNGLQGTDGL